MQKYYNNVGLSCEVDICILVFLIPVVVCIVQYKVRDMLTSPGDTLHGLQEALSALVCLILLIKP